MWHLFLILLLLNFGISVVCLTQALFGEELTHRNVSRKMSLVIGARHHLEWGHEKYILETINSHPALVSISVLFLLITFFTSLFPYGSRVRCLISHVKFAVMIWCIYLSDHDNYSVCSQ